MCLAVPGQILTCDGQEAVVDLQGNRLKISTMLTPNVRQGEWVLVHAGFAITSISQQDARETWDYLRASLGVAPDEAGAIEPQSGTTEWPEASSN